MYKFMDAVRYIFSHYPYSVLYIQNVEIFQDI